MRRLRLLAPALTVVVVAASLATIQGPPLDTTVASESLAEDGSILAVEGVNAAYIAGRNAGGGNVIASQAVEYEGEWLELAHLSTGRRALEPTIGVDTSGNAYYAASWHDDSVSIVLPVTQVRRTTDGGITWENVSPVIPVANQPNPPVNADPYVVVDQDTDRIFNPEAAGACLYMNISDDAGESWLTNPIVCGGGNVDHQSFELGPFPPAMADLETTYPNVLWYCSNQVADSQCSYSIDGGIAWLPGGAAYAAYTPAGGLCTGGLTGHLEVDSEGRVFLPKGHCSAPWISVSEDLGRTWTQRRVAPMSAAGTHLALAIDDADNLYFLWWDAENRLPWLSVSRDHGVTWGTPMMVAPPGVAEVNFPEITAGEEGKIAIVFPGTTVNNRSDNKRPWNYYAVVSTNALDDEPLFVSSTANPLDNPVHRGNCGPGRCGAMWDFIDIVVSPVDGGFWATLSDTCESAGCRSATGSIDNVSSGMGIAVRQLGGPRVRDVAPQEPATP